MKPSDFTLATECAVTVHDMGEAQLVLEQRNEGSGKAERVALCLEDLQTILRTLEASRYGTAKNTDRIAAEAVSV